MSRKNALRIAGFGLTMFCLGWGVVKAVEAEKEVRILCSMVYPGQPESAVYRIFDTVEHSRLRAEGESASTRLHLSSIHNLWSTRCDVRLERGEVIVRRYVADAY
jgi:hypothetical protein